MNAQTAIRIFAVLSLPLYGISCWIVVYLEHRYGVEV
jgi:hypothetical protein